jgi:SOS-response transcriptional repressor LexA
MTAYPKTPLGKGGLTARQRDIYEFIASTYRDKGMPPAIRDICVAFGINSTNGVNCHLQALVSKGWLAPVDAGQYHRYLPAGYVVVSEDELRRLRGGA